MRTGGLVLRLYSHSLGLSLLALFVACFLLHAIHSARRAAAEALAHGEPPAGWTDHIGSAAFWFESFQNWQSEFLSTAVLILLAIVLRERRSPESKAVSAPHAQTGT